MGETSTIQETKEFMDNQTDKYFYIETKDNCCYRVSRDGRMEKQWAQGIWLYLGHGANSSCWLSNKWRTWRKLINYEQNK
jgi:hypothetical protein